MLAGTSNDHFVPIPKGKKRDVVGSLEAGEVAYTVGYGDYRKAKSYAELLSVIEGSAIPKVNEWTSPTQPVTLFFDIDFKKPVSIDDDEKAKEADIQSKLIYGREVDNLPSDDDFAHTQPLSTSSSSDTEEEMNRRDEELARQEYGSESETDAEPMNYALPLTSHFDVPASQMTQPVPRFTDAQPFGAEELAFSNQMNNRHQ